MESIHLKNEDLKLLLSNDIKDNSFILLHNISLEAYSSKITDFSEDIRNRYKIYKENITCIDIANAIIQRGLYVPYNTLRCTATFIGNTLSLNEDNLNYLYRKSDVEDNTICTVLTTIPSSIKINDDKYFIGNLTKKSSGLIEPTISTDLLFKNTLPPAFIYGYYTKEILNDTFTDELELTINNSHISRMNDHEKNYLYESILTKENISLDILDAVNREDINYRSNQIHTDLCIRNAIYEKRKMKYGR